MNDDQSFYEIQLNTPHVVLVVLAGVVVGMALFYLGVIVGSGQAATAAPSDWQAAAPVEEREDNAGGGSADALEDGGESMPLVPADESPAEEETSTGSDATAELEPTTAAEETEADPPAQTESFQPADPIEEEPAPVVADSRSGLPQADASLATGWVVQVRSTPDQAAANTLQEALSGAGFPAFVISAEVDGTTYYRVRVGRYAARTDADVVEEALLQRADVEDAWVTEG